MNFIGFGIGVEEKSLISILGKWHPEQRKSFRKGVREFFIEDERQFERWDDRHIARLEREFLRFKVRAIFSFFMSNLYVF